MLRDQSKNRTKYIFQASSGYNLGDCRIGSTATLREIFLSAMCLSAAEIRSGRYRIWVSRAIARLFRTLLERRGQFYRHHYVTHTLQSPLHSQLRLSPYYWKRKMSRMSENKGIPTVILENNIKFLEMVIFVQVSNTSVDRKQNTSI